MRYLMALALVAALAIPSYAAFSGPGETGAQGGFKGPGPKGAITQAVQVKSAADDTPVVLEGNIVEQLRKDRYLFRDASGTVLVDIDHKDFRGQDVTPQTKVRLTGEVDAKRNRDNEVDVDRLDVIQ